MHATDILLLDGESPFTLKVVRSLALVKRWRIHVLGCLTQGRKPVLAWSRHVASFQPMAADGDERSVLDAIRRAVKRTGAWLVVPVTEPTILFCIHHREALAQFVRVGPLPPAESFACAIDKGSLAEFMKERGLAHPDTWLPRDGRLLAARFPALVKPRRACNGKGFAKVESADQLQAELSRRPDRDFVCVQEWVDGVDVGCSVLVREGRIEAWTTQRGVRRLRPYTAHAEVQMEVCEAALAVTSDLMRALAWSGVANVDLRVDARTGRTLVLEVNGRYWNSLGASTIAGVNFPDLACRMSLGEKMPVCHQRSIRYVHPRLWCRDLLQGRRSAFPPPWTGLPDVLSDPLPEVTRFSRSLGRLVSRRQVPPASRMGLPKVQSSPAV